MKCFSFVRFARLAAISLSSLALFAVASRAQSRPITIDDYFRLLSVHDPQLSPDGKWVAYAVDTSSLKTDKTGTRLWMIPTSGGEPIPLTTDSTSASHPRWSPDGKFIAFLSARDKGKTQVWLLNRLGGDAEPLTSTPQDVDDFAWSPDSRKLVLILRDPTPEELHASKEPSSPKSSPDDDSSNPPDPIQGQPSASKKPWVIDRLQFKVDTVGYLDRRRTHLYLFDLTSKSLAQITSGDYDDSEPAWSPDSKLLAFSSNRSQPDPDRTYNSDIWVVSADNSDKGAHLTQVTTNPGADNQPAWSPDGKSIAYVTNLDPKLFDYATKHLAISPATGGSAKVLTLSLDRNISNPHFSPDGRSIYFIADDDGTQNLLAVPSAGGTVTRPIPGRIMLVAYSVAPTGEIAAQIATIDRPDELFTIPNGHLTQLTHLNDALFSKLQIAHGDYVHFKSKDGTTIAGYLYKPLNFVSGQTVPTLLIPHGGPQWAYYAEFSFLAQLYAANGYAVLFPNPRGSTGYGQDFCKAIFADWGNKDFQDDMAIVDYAIAQGISDPHKLGVGGWSYGGISTDFIITQTTRFKAAISGAGAAEFISLYGHDQYQRDYETELGLPWEAPAVWQHVSSYRNITKVTTPTLFLGGNIDWNVPVLGGEQMYQSLKRLGVPTELVIYPGEYHEFSLPSHLKDRFQRDLAWYAHYVKGDSTPATPRDTGN